MLFVFTFLFINLKDAFALFVILFMSVVYLTISALTDCHTLQSDLHKLEKWEEEWLMSFNPDKCEIIHISRKQTDHLPIYTTQPDTQVNKQSKIPRCHYY
jgi:hypothetical protein